MRAPTVHIDASYGTLGDVSLCIYGAFAVFTLLYYTLGQEGLEIGPYSPETYHLGKSNINKYCRQATEYKMKIQIKWMEREHQSAFWL